MSTLPSSAVRRQTVTQEFGDWKSPLLSAVGNRRSPLIGGKKTAACLFK